MNRYIIIILIIFILYFDYNIINKYINIIKLFYLENIFAILAPVVHNVEKKKFSDQIYIDKYIVENIIKIPLNEVKIKHVKTINYNKHFNQEYFEKITDNLTKPLLIKNVYNNNDLKKYNFKFMKNNYGNIIVNVLKNNTEMNTMKFKEYIDKITKGEKMYLTVNNSIANALNTDNFTNFFNNIIPCEGFQNTFIGNKNSYTHLHCELSASCAIQLNGTKKWYLIDPLYSEHLHPIVDKNKIFRISYKGFFNDNLNIPRYEIICEKGDFLYVPPWWWHETLNLTDENIMYSFRPSLFIAPYKTNLMYTLLSLKNSLAFNNIIYPLLVKFNLINPNEDTVVKSIRQIKHRIPKFILK